MQRINLLLHTRQTAVIISTSHTLEALIHMFEEVLPAPIAPIDVVEIELHGRVALDNAREVHRMSVGGRIGAPRGEADGAGQGVAGCTPIVPDVVGDTCDRGQVLIAVHST